VGADLLTANLWQKANTELDWSAGRRKARELTVEACHALAEQMGYWDEEEESDPADIREKAVAYVDTLQSHVEGFSRVYNAFTTPDGRYWCHLTGGMSWGDSPSDLYDAINDLYAVPEVLEAIGFVTGQERTDGQA